MMVSFGPAGVETPGYNAVGPMMRPSAWVAVMCVPSKTKNEGDVMAPVTVVLRRKSVHT
jgi:hypothetical protein